MLIRFAVILAGVLTACAVAEVALRVTNAVPEVANPLYSFHESDPVLGWRGKSDVRLRFRRPEFSTVVAHGPDGWRIAAPPPPADPRRRVLVLGDSFTWGWGVGQGELFTDHLQRALPDTSIANRGVNGFGTAQEYLLLQRELAAAHYDTVVLMFFLNDLRDNVDPKSGRRPLFALDGDRLVPRNQPPLPLTTPLQRFFKDHSRAFDLIAFQISLLTRRFGEDERSEAGADDGTAADYRRLPGAAVTIRLLEEMNRLVHAHGARFVLVYIPQHSEHERLPSRFPDVRAAHALLADTAQRNGIPLVDLSPAFNAAVRQGAQLAYAHDEHWTPAGHELAAGVILSADVLR